MTRSWVTALALAGVPRMAAAGHVPATVMAPAPTPAPTPPAPTPTGTPTTRPGMKSAILDAKAAAHTQANADPAQTKAASARWDRDLRRRVGRRPAPVINVFNTWTHEYVVVDAGRGVTMPVEAVNRFLRCHFTNRETTMDTRLFGVLLAAANHFKSARVDIVSGFRAPKYNLMLRKKGHRVARDSQHTVGHAVDFRLAGVTTESLRNWARRLRLGGVGYYQNDQFVHVDVGPIRYWKE